MEERKRAAEAMAEQRKSDLEFCCQMRFLLPDTTPTSIVRCDVEFECEGRPVDGDRYKQGVLSPYVRAHGSIVAKRCLWLGKLIEVAKR